MKNFLARSLFFILIITASRTSWTAPLRNFSRAKKSPALEKILTDPEVAKIKETCDQQANLDPKLDIGDCIWVKLSKEKREYILEKGIEGHDEIEVNLKTTTSTRDQAVEALENYFFKRLREAMYGLSSEEKKTIVAKEVFYKLYESQIGRHVITAISSYCLEADQTNSFFISEDLESRNEQKNKNIASLSSFEMIKEKSKERKVSRAYTSWSKCLLSIQHICHKTKSYKDKTNEPDFEYSNKRACVVTKFIQSARANMITVNRITKAMKEHTLSRGGFSPSNYSVFTGNGDSGKTLDELTTVTSNEAVNTSGYDQETKNIAKEFEKECLTNKNEKVCGSYIGSKEGMKELRDAQTEYSLKTKAMEAKIEKLKNKESMATYLEKQKRSKENIKKILSKSEAEIRTEILNRYKTEREGILASMRDKMLGRTRIGEKTDQKSAQTNNKLLSNIAEELKSRSQNLKQLIFFNNMVSGYLRVKDSTNSSATYRELGDSAFDPRGRSTASSKAQSLVNFKEIKKKTQKNFKNNSDATNTNLDVETINNTILKLND